MLLNVTGLHRLVNQLNVKIICSFQNGVCMSIDIPPLGQYFAETIAVSRLGHVSTTLAHLETFLLEINIVHSVLQNCANSIRLNGEHQSQSVCIFKFDLKGSL